MHRLKWFNIAEVCQGLSLISSSNLSVYYRIFKDSFSKSAELILKYKIPCSPLCGIWISTAWQKKGGKKIKRGTNWSCSACWTHLLGVTDLNKPTASRWSSSAEKRVGKDKANEGWSGREQLTSEGSRSSLWPGPGTGSCLCPSTAAGAALGGTSLTLTLLTHASNPPTSRERSSEQNRCPSQPPSPSPPPACNPI